MFPGLLLKRFFRSCANKCRYVVIYACPSDRKYSHLKYFEEKSKYEERTTRYGVRIRCYITLKLPCLRGCQERNIVEWVNSSRINLVVTCTADCTYHHLTNSRKKLKFPAEMRNSKQIWEFNNRKCCPTW